MTTAYHSATNTNASGLAEDGGLVLLPLDQVHPSPCNPRTDFDEAALEELADSLRRHGMLQPITVRQDLDRGGYEVIAGERRLRAAQIAGWVQIPSIVRVCTDTEALELALVENLARRDINPLEEARGYLTLAGMGLTQAEIAQRVNRQQPTISNRMRLLRLPEGVQELISAGKLSPSHGVALLQHYDGFPVIAGHVAAWAAENAIPVATLEKGLESVDWPTLVSMQKSGLIRDIDYRTEFDTAVCKQCPLGAYKVSGYRTYCLRPDHYAELKAAALAEQSQRVEAARESLRQRAAAPGEAPVEVPDPPELSKLRYDQYELLSNHVPNCDASCPCRGKAIDQQGRLVEICTNPTRRRSLHAQATKAERKALRDTFGESLAQLVELQAKPDAAATSRALAVLCRRELSNARVEDLRATAKTLPEGPLRTRLEQPPYKHNESAAWSVFAAIPNEALIHVVVQVLARAEAREKAEYKSSDTPLIDWLLGRESMPKEATNAPALAPIQAEDQPDAFHEIMGEHCCRCGDALPEDLLEVDGCTEDEYHALHDPRGHVMLENGLPYCGACWPDVRRCRGCGCTNEAGCPEGCERVEADLCSVCADARGVEDAPTAAAADPWIPPTPIVDGMALRSRLLPDRRYMVHAVWTSGTVEVDGPDGARYEMTLEDVRQRFTPEGKVVPA